MPILNLTDCLKKIIIKVFSSVKIFKLLEGLVGFGYLRLRRSKVVPQLSKLLSSAKRSLPDPKIGQNLDFLQLGQRPLGTSGVVRVDIKVVPIGPL